MCFKYMNMLIICLESNGLFGDGAFMLLKSTWIFAVISINKNIKRTTHSVQKLVKVLRRFLSSGWNKMATIEWARGIVSCNSYKNCCEPTQMSFICFHLYSCMFCLSFMQYLIHLPACIIWLMWWKKRKGIGNLKVSLWVCPASGMHPLSSNLHKVCRKPLWLRVHHTQGRGATQYIGL